MCNRHLFWLPKFRYRKLFVCFFEWTHPNCGWTTALCVKQLKLNTCWHTVRYKISFLKISVQMCMWSISLIHSRFIPWPQTGCGRSLAIKLQHSNVQVTIIYTWVNFAVRGSQICMLSQSEQWVIEWSLTKNRIEFERGSKLLGTSSQTLEW